MSRRYQIVAIGSVVAATDNLQLAERTARSFSRNVLNLHAHVFDLASKMIIYRANNGDDEYQPAPVRRLATSAWPTDCDCRPGELESIIDRLESAR